MAHQLGRRLVGPDGQMCGASAGVGSGPPIMTPARIGPRQTAGADLGMTMSAEVQSAA